MNFILFVYGFASPVFLEFFFRRYMGATVEMGATIFYQLLTQKIKWCYTTATHKKSFVWSQAKVHQAFYTLGVRKTVLNMSGTI